MSYPSYTYTFMNNTKIIAAQCNENFNNLLSGIIDGTKNMNVNAFSATGSMSVAGDVYTKELSDYYTSSTVAGWASMATGNIYYKKIGKTVFVDFYLNGTSNATTAKITLPYSHNAASVFTNLHVPIKVIDSSSNCVGHACLSSSNVLNFYNGATSGTTFINSGTKTIQGTFIYEAA